MSAPDRAALHAALDASTLCHIAYADADGIHNLPMACWRDGEHLYIHGSNGNPLIRALVAGTPVCVAVCLLDGLVLARSAFAHTMNYRSVLMRGCFERVPEDAAKRAALDTFMRRLLPGREREARPGNAKELAATTVLRIGLEHAVCKMRSGGPRDDDADLALPVWAGVLPFELRRGAAQPEPGCTLPLPAYLQS